MALYMLRTLMAIVVLSISGCGPKGETGKQGGQGIDGTNGINGTPCTVSSIPASGLVGALDQYGGTMITCPNGSSFISNGATGQAGTNGTNGANGGTVNMSLVQVIEPCGAASSPYKEVILGLQGGQLLSSFSENNNGLNTRFSFIPNGTYQDTDSSHCTFTVTGNGSTTSMINWGAGSNSYSSWPAGGFVWNPTDGWKPL